MESRIYSRRALVRTACFAPLGVLLGALGTTALRQRVSTGSSPVHGQFVEPLPAAGMEAHVVRPTLALSLTTAQAEAAKLQQTRRPLPETLTYLGGMNRLQGFIAEPDGELVLLGENDTSLPLVHLDDLAVACRNAYETDPVYQGAPGCSIDPWHGTKDPWRIQTVTIFGMPAVPMAARHVAFDYELKRVSAGLASLGDDIPSLYDLARSAALPCIKRSNEAQRTEVTHRFWFFPRYPSPPRFLADAGLVLILHPVEVQLLSEQEFFSRTGQRIGGAPASPQAEQFARAITQLLATHHHYAHLVSDFRVIEVGRLFRFQQVPAASLHYLLHEYPLTEAPVPAFIGGVRREERGEMVCASQITERRGPQGQRIETQEQVQRSHWTFRGGVEAQVELTADQFAEEYGGTLRTLRQQVWASRPSSHTLLWPIARIGNPTAILPPYCRERPHSPRRPTAAGGAA